MKTSLYVSAASLFLLLAACGKGAPPATPSGATPGADEPTPPASTKAESKTDPTFAACHATFAPTGDDVAANVDAMAKGCADATKMKKMGDTLSGSGTDKTGWASFPFPAAAGKCYRVYGVAQGTAQDMDLTLLDSAGGLVAVDVTTDFTPVIQEDGKVCFKTADSATLKVRVEAGGGKYAIQVWSD
jgi:hypothetical protein